MDTENRTTDTWYVIINPAGGSGAVQKYWPIWKTHLLEAGLIIKEAFTERKMHAAELVNEAVSAGFRRIMAVGGDGTNNEVINGILFQKIVDTTAITYAILPIGTGNDWVKSHDIPKKMGAWLDMLKAGYTELQDIGKVNYQSEGGASVRYFANVAGLAYDAFVVDRIDKSGTWVRGRMIYLLFIMACLFRYKLRKARVMIDDQPFEGRFYTINVGICKYSGGGMQFVPHANPADGKLAYTTAGDLSFFDVLRATPYFYNGKVAKYKTVKTGFAQSIRVEELHPDSGGPTQLEVDGEYLGTSPVLFSLMPRALKFIRPPR